MKPSWMIYSDDSLLICLNSGTKRRLREITHSLLDEANFIIPDPLPSKFYMLRIVLTYQTNISSTSSETIFKTKVLLSW